MNTKYDYFNEERFYMMGDVMGMWQRQVDGDAVMPEGGVFISAEQAAPHVEAFTFPEHRSAFISGFVSGYRHIEIRKLREKYGTQHD